jgi:hypothetical protein
LRESDRPAFDLELHMNCDAFLSHDVPEDIWLEPLSIELLAHFRHNGRRILGTTADFDRIHRLRPRQE